MYNCWLDIVHQSLYRHLWIGERFVSLDFYTVLKQTGGDAQAGVAMQLRIQKKFAKNLGREFLFMSMSTSTKFLSIRFWWKISNDYSTKNLCLEIVLCQKYGFFRDFSDNQDSTEENRSFSIEYPSTSAKLLLHALVFGGRNPARLLFWRSLSLKIDFCK